MNIVEYTSRRGMSCDLLQPSLPVSEKSMVLQTYNRVCSVTQVFIHQTTKELFSRNLSDQKGIVWKYKLSIMGPHSEYEGHETDHRVL